MKKFLIVLLIILILVLAVLLGIRIYQTEISEKKVLEQASNEIKKDTTPQEEKKVEIFQGDSRPIAVMIDNVGVARPQAGLNDAYIVYEIIVEGNQTRLMALFKDKDISKIGPIRSSRHYFLDYALENDAIYVHFGWSPKAQSDISSLKVNNINGINESSKSFWRVKDKSAPHNVVTSTEKILDIAKRKGYSTTSEKDSVLNYVVDEVELKDGETANEVVIPYSGTYKVSYKYDEETKRYTRTYNKTTQNDGSGKGRQNLSNIGTLDGYYITNGKAIKIKCYKTARKEQTIYKDLEGKEIEVNDGNTFIQIVPIDSKITME